MSVSQCLAEVKGMRGCVCVCASACVLVSRPSHSTVEIAGKSIKKGFRLVVSGDGWRVSGTEVSVLLDKKEVE